MSRSVERREAVQRAARLGEVRPLTRRERAAMEAEEWRAVIGMEGRYEVSSHGRVRTLLTRVPARYLTIIKARPNLHGYPTVTLRRADGKTCCVTVHGLVARAFLGEPPDGTQVAHGDGDKTNAHVNNLRYATPLENIADREKHGTTARGLRNGVHTKPHRRARGERNGQSKLTAATVASMRRDSAAGMNNAAIGRKYGVSKTTARYVVVGLNWRSDA